MTKHEIQDQIDALRVDAGEHGDDDLVASCQLASGYEVYDSDTGNLIEPAELPSKRGERGNAIVRYVGAICLSLNEGVEGHIRIAGRRIYAA